MNPTPSWTPFQVLTDRHAPAPRPIHTADGIADRLRAAAFAELQAFEAFKWAAQRFTDAPQELRDIWTKLAREEERHLNWLLKRMKELGIDVGARPVSNLLWQSFMKCETGEQFAKYMASAEERGKRAGERFYAELLKLDQTSAEIFKKIAEEEAQHIDWAGALSS